MVRTFRSVVRIVRTLRGRELMAQGGRPLQYIGVRSKDLRIRYVSLARPQRTRGFYARWRPDAQVWECQLSGFGMKPRHWFAHTQSLALSNLRFIESLWNWRAVIVDQAVNWDGVYDFGLHIIRVSESCELSGDAPTVSA